jgi:pyridinium-3,5-bisthiocarboxylic acid mononucleotide nickel chelatase
VSARHIHIDPVGGIAGDMFAAAMLDAFPALGDGLLDALRKAGLADDVIVRWERVTDEVLAGTRFAVDDPRERKGPRPPYAALAPGHAQHAHHEHVPFTQLRDRIAASGLPALVVARALDIFTRVARAEAEVHGFADVDAVVLHEVGAMDSVADIVAAAWLIENAQASSWSCASLPLGSGTVTTAHGVLPIPAPATAVLLRGLPVHDDGRPGERVTPTGAAIVASLVSPMTRARPRGTLRATGTGWGTKRFPGLPNVVRVLELIAETQVAREVISALSFDIDDQPAEDLAIALDHLRATDGVLDVLQAPAFGKKGRMVSQVRVLVRSDVENAVVDACLRETTTLGVRIERVERAVLAREEITRDVDGANVRVKRVTRPDGVTAKADSDDVAALPSAARRARAKRNAEKDDDT